MVLNRRSFVVATVIVLMLIGSGPLIWAQAAKDQHVEIFVEGRKYNSIEDYREEEKNKNLQSIAITQAGDVSVGQEKQGFDELRKMSGEIVRHAGHPLGVTFDPHKVKALYLKDFLTKQPVEKVEQNPVSMKDRGFSIADPLARSYTVFHQVGFNAGINHAVDDFIIGHDQSGVPQQVNRQDIDRVLEESLGTDDGPLLFVSDQKKIRVMALEPLESKAISNIKMQAQ